MQLRLRNPGRADRLLAEMILCETSAYYLDDRFSISMRAALGIR